VATELDRLVPSITQSLEGIGFLFGAGTSVDAGYPLMSNLTRAVVGRLTTGERSHLDALLAAAGLTYDAAAALPNIEGLSDLTIAHAINAGDAASSALEERLKELIVDELLSVSSPRLDDHVRFFEALKSRAFGLPSLVWIFTTNYDVLLETAASLAGVELHTGFSGSTTRYFDPAQFANVRGQIKDKRFRRNDGLTVNLLKLHGSLSWTSSGSQLIEQHPASLASDCSRTMVLPRRRKVIDTLAPPYDQIFSCASRIVGSTCRYLISCGFSFSDEHVNQTILMPSLKAGRLRLVALCENEPASLSGMVALPSFNGSFSAYDILAGKRSGPGSTLWKFCDLVKAL
jgi:hypothetical protein